MLEGSILQLLEAAHQGGETGKRHLNFGVYYKNTLVSLCHALEDCVLSEDSPPLMLTAFQRGKWYLEEADRYGQIADHTRQVVIMAAADAGFNEHPTSQRSQVTVVELTPEDPVAQEWHLMILSPSYTAMVLCQELSLADYGDQPPESDLQRKFYGLWTFETELVQEAIDLTIAHIGAYNPDLQVQLQAHVQTIQAEAQQADPLHFYSVVSRVVDYLQANQQTLQPVQTAQQLDRNLLSNEVQAFLRVAQLIDLMDPDNPQATTEVTALVEMICQLLDLPAWQAKRLRLASILHRLAPFQGTPQKIIAPSVSSQAAPHSRLACALVPGVQALRQMPKLRAIAQIIAHQTEWWNGNGEPAGLVGDEIPLESRILGLVIDFQQRVNGLAIPKTINDGQVDEWQDQLELALVQCQQWAGDRWDPKLVEMLTIIVNGLQQGLTLPLQSPRLTNGLWLLDS
ncbi:MAG: metal-dependent phosphohydrolase [Aphanocapsa sp. GSE-SYN-MK-11-07L]|jgi:DICT domain-containing protein|nr:metal-dependent phosphohydrolase [Aphanocapsa sp. GSE-SYN-MK-11-07L]